MAKFTIALTIMGFAVLAQATPHEYQGNGLKNAYDTVMGKICGYKGGKADGTVGQGDGIDSATEIAAESKAQVEAMIRDEAQFEAEQAAQLAVDGAIEAAIDAAVQVAVDNYQNLDKDSCGYSIDAIHLAARASARGCAQASVKAAAQAAARAAARVAMSLGGGFSGGSELDDSLRGIIEVGSKGEATGDTKGIATRIVDHAKKVLSWMG